MRYFAVTSLRRMILRTRWSLRSFWPNMGNIMDAIWERTDRVNQRNLTCLQILTNKYKLVIQWAPNHSRKWNWLWWWFIRKWWLIRFQAGIGVNGTSLHKSFLMQSVETDPVIILRFWLEPAGVPLAACSLRSGSPEIWQKLYLQRISWSALPSMAMSALATA